MASLAISLLGRFQVCLENQETASLEAGRPGALLAYLTVEASRAHSRASLAELFWPDRPQNEGLASLRYTLSNLRTTLKDRLTGQSILLVERDHVQINPAADIWVDSLSFETMASSLQQAGSDPDLEELQFALKLYRGSFLQDFIFGESLAFESWALGKREQLERIYLRLLHLLAAGLETRSSVSEAEDAYRRILEVQPWDEGAHRQLMHLLSSSGQRAAALAQYQACRLALGELGLEPNRETNLLYHWIIRMPGGTSDQGDTTSLALPGIPLVARQGELERMEAGLERMLAGQGQILLVSGEAGSGKTALLSEFARLALERHPELLVAGGQCDAHTGAGQPYQPFVECIQMLGGEWQGLPWAEHLSGEAQQRLIRSVPKAAQILVENAPVLLDRFVNRSELGQHVQDQQPGAHPKPAWQRLLEKAPSRTVPRMDTSLLYEQIARLLTGISKHYPLVLLLDDLHWTDPGSAALLFYLVRRFTTARILILAAFRPGEVYQGRQGEEHPLLAPITEIQRYGGKLHLDLDRADEGEFVSAFLEKDPQLQPNELDQDFQAALARRTGGNPLFTIELLRSLQAHGDLYRNPQGAWVNSPTLEWDHLPERVEAAIAGRMRRLPAEWLDWLSTASVEGDSFTAEVVERVHGLDEKTLLQALNGPLGIGRGAHRLVQGEGVIWVHAQGDRPKRLSRYRFRHIMFQNYLYQQLNPVERSRRHAEVASTLEALYAGQPELRARHAAELARHFEASGLLEKAAAFHLEAGQYARYLVASQIAVDHYRRGIELIENQPHQPERDRLEIRLYMALGAPFLFYNTWGGPERQQAIQKALELLREMTRAGSGSENPASQWPELFPALYTQSDWLLSRGEVEQATRLGEQILALAGEVTGLPHALGHFILGFSQVFQGDFPKARQNLEDTWKIYTMAGRPSTLQWIGADLESLCQALLGIVLAIYGYPDQASAQANQALSRVRSLKYAPALGGVLVFSYENAFLRRDLAALQTITAEFHQLGLMEGMHFFEAYELAAKGYLNANQAEAGSAEAKAGVKMIQQGMQLWESMGNQLGRGMWIVRLADACLCAEEIAAGLQVIESTLESENIKIEGYLSKVYRLKGELLLKQEPVNTSAALACFIRSLEIARQQEAHTFELRTAICLAKLWRFEKPDEAKQLLEDTCDWFREGFDTQDWREAQGLLNSLRLSI